MTKKINTPVAPAKKVAAKKVSIKNSKQELEKLIKTTKARSNVNHEVDALLDFADKVKKYKEPTDNTNADFGKLSGAKTPKLDFEKVSQRVIKDRQVAKKSATTKPAAKKVVVKHTPAPVRNWEDADTFGKFVAKLALELPVTVHLKEAMVEIILSATGVDKVNSLTKLHLSLIRRLVADFVPIDYSAVVPVPGQYWAKDGNLRAFVLRANEFGVVYQVRSETVEDQAQNVFAFLSGQEVSTIKTFRQYLEATKSRLYRPEESAVKAALDAFETMALDKRLIPPHLPSTEAERDDLFEVEEFTNEKKISPPPKHLRHIAGAHWVRYGLAGTMSRLLWWDPDMQNYAVPRLHPDDINQTTGMQVDVTATHESSKQTYMRPAALVDVARNANSYKELAESVMTAIMNGGVVGSRPHLVDRMAGLLKEGMAPILEKVGVDLGADKVPDYKVVARKPDVDEQIMIGLVSGTDLVWTLMVGKTQNREFLPLSFKVATTYHG